MLWVHEACPAQHLSPFPHGSALRGANTGLCFYCGCTVGRGRLGRGPGQEDLISSDFKGLFCFRKGSGFHSTSLHPSHAQCFWDPFPTCYKSIISPPEEPLNLRWGGETLDGKGHQPLFPKDVCHSFPSVISRGMMPFSQLPSKSWPLQRADDIEQWN